MNITRSQVLANREKWINFLIVKGRKKAEGALDEGGGARCCLGHGAYVLGVERNFDNYFSSKISYGADQETAYAPKELIDMVGLWTNIGAPHSDSDIGLNVKGKYFYENLADANDHTSTIRDADYEVEDRKPAVSPRDIGLYLRKVIEGGPETPWRALSDYPEQIDG